MNRRSFIRLVGGGIVLAASAAATTFAVTRTPEKALAPWRLAGSYNEPRMKALSYAILAPNPHNRQPWLADLRTPDRIRLMVDRTRLLPYTDPFNRQITIGLGCFLELLRMAAAADGYRATITPFPDGGDERALDERPIADVAFVRDGTVAADPLFKHALARRSLKEPYDLDRPVPDGALRSLEQASGGRDVAIGTSNDPTFIAHWRKLTRDALHIEIVTPRTYQESVDLFRIGRAEIEANSDGIDFSGVLFESLAGLGQFSRTVALDRNSMAYRQGYASVMANTDTAMGYVWLNTNGNSRPEQLAAGRDWLRVNLAATAIGLATQPLSQILQEYSEMAELYRQCHAELAPNGGTVQMLARLGYGPAVGPSPRWEVTRKILEA